MTNGSTREAVMTRVSQLQKLVENTEETFQKNILKERIVRLSGGIAIIQVAIEERVVVGGGCCLLRLSLKVDGIKELIDNDEQKIGVDIVKRALLYPIRQIAKNAGVNGNVVIEKTLSVGNIQYGYNAAKDQYEDLIDAGILYPVKVVRCCLEHAASISKSFLTSDTVVVYIDEPSPVLKEKTNVCGRCWTSKHLIWLCNPNPHEHAIRD